jgi:Recombinase zinc beta ribbon domain
MTGHSTKSSTRFYYLCSRKYKRGDEACDARMLPKEKLKQQVIAQLKTRVLIDENIDKLVELVNAELISAHSGLQERIDSVSEEISDVDARLSRL